MPATQSAYRKFHSTETAVTKLYNDLLLAADGGQVSALCLLDLTAAFDTVDHDLLILRLERQYGIRGVVLEWLRSYLSGRSFCVVCGSEISVTETITETKIIDPTLTETETEMMVILKTEIL